MSDGKFFRLKPESIELFEQFKSDKGIRKDSDAIAEIIGIAVVQYPLINSKLDERNYKLSTLQKNYNKLVSLLQQRTEIEKEIIDFLNY